MFFWDHSGMTALLVLPCCWSLGCRQHMQRHTKNMSVVHGTFWDEPSQTFCAVHPSISKMCDTNCPSVLRRIQSFEEPHPCGEWRTRFTNECLNGQGALGRGGAMCWVLVFAWRQLQVGSAGLGSEKNRFLVCVTSSVWLFKNGI